MKLTVSRDTDYELLTWERKSGEVLRLWDPITTLGVPSVSWFQNLTAVVVDPVDMNGLAGYDFRGVTRDGKLSRFISVGVQVISYEGVDQDAAGHFDQTLKSACYR